MSITGRFSIRDAEVTGPPAVTVPLDQLNPDDVIHNNALGAAITKPKGSGSRTFKKPQPMACPDMTPVKKEFPASAVKPSPLVKEKAVIKGCGICCACCKKHLNPQRPWDLPKPHRALKLWRYSRLKLSQRILRMKYLKRLD